MNPYVALALCNVLAGLSYPVTMWALRGFNPIQLVFLKGIVYLFLFFPAAFRAIRARSVRATDWIPIVAAGVFGYGVPAFIGTVGLAGSSATHGVLLDGVEPISIVLLSALFLGERFSGAKALAVLLGIGGAAAIVLQGSGIAAAASAPSYRGDLLLALTGFFWSLHTVIGKPVLRRMDADSFAALASIVSVFPVALASMSSPSLRSPLPHSMIAWAAMAYLCVVSGFYVTLLWNQGLGKVDASVLANFIFLQPLAGVVSGVLLLGDKFTVWTGLGGFLILVGVYVSSRAERSGTSQAGWSGSAEGA